MSQGPAGGGAVARAACALWLAVAGCDAGPTADAGRCRFGPERAIAGVVHPRFDDLQLAAHAGGALALWSGPAGLFVRQLSATGEARAPARRLAAPCEGGLSTTPGAGGVVIACLRPGAGAGGVTLYAISDASQQGPLSPRGSLGDVGGLSRGVAAAITDGVVHVAYRDSDAQHHHVMYARARVGAGEGAIDVLAPPSRLSAPGVAAGPPHLLAFEGAARVAYSEASLQQGSPVVDVVVRELGDDRPPVRFRVVEPDAMPRLARLGAQLHVAYRDRHRRGERTGLYVRAVPPGRTPGTPLRLARADGDATPALVECLGGLVASTPRTFAGDYFVGVNWVRSGPVRGAPEQQFYEDAHEFTHTAAACVGGRALLLVGERGRPGQATTSLRAVPYLCR